MPSDPKALIIVSSGHSMVPKYCFQFGCSSLAMNLNEVVTSRINDFSTRSPRQPNLFRVNLVDVIDRFMEHISLLH